MSNLHSKNQGSILLPGLDEQLFFLLDKVSLIKKRSLVIGAGSEEIARRLFHSTNESVELIVDNYDAFINSRIAIEKNESINCSLMDYHATDFPNEFFDLVYSQASITTPLHQKILKEVFRILKPDGFLCVGELIKLSTNVPKFVTDILKSAELSPMSFDELLAQYLSVGFSLVDKTDLSESFFKYFEQARKKALEAKQTLNENEISFYKKLFNRFSHEANSFLKHGGDKHIGFHAFIFQKGVKN
ncbi:MAG: hypothetical protein Fur0015_08180 [Ignavibacteriales bacterium]